MFSVHAAPLHDDPRHPLLLSPPCKRQRAATLDFESPASEDPNSAEAPEAQEAQEAQAADMLPFSSCQESTADTEQSLVQEPATLSHREQEWETTPASPSRPPPSLQAPDLQTEPQVHPPPQEGSCSSTSTGTKDCSCDPSQREDDGHASRTPPFEDAHEGTHAPACSSSASCCDGGDQVVCRFCLESESSEENPMIAPCLCSGSMRYIHRQCLNEWRVKSFNPQALVCCTTCKAEFRTRYEGKNPRLNGPKDGWKTRFAKDLAWYLGIRLFAFLGTSIAVGFWPYWLAGAGAMMLHPNPVVNHLLVGGGTSLASMGVFMVVQIPGLWQTGEGFRLVLELFGKGKGGGSSQSSGLEVLVVIFVVIGIFVCLYYLIKGIVHLLYECKQEVVRAVRGANEEVRRQIVNDFVVLDFQAPEAEAEAAVNLAAISDQAVVQAQL